MAGLKKRMRKESAASAAACRENRSPVLFSFFHFWRHCDGVQENAEIRGLYRDHRAGIQSPQVQTCGEGRAMQWHAGGDLLKGFYRHCLGDTHCAQTDAPGAVQYHAGPGGDRRVAAEMRGRVAFGVAQQLLSRAF